MKFPKENSSQLMKQSRLLSLAICIVFLTVTGFGQKSDLMMTQQQANLDQCRNGAADSPVRCEDLPGGHVGWVNGNAGPENSHWQEDDFIAYRMLFSGLQPGSTVHTLVLGYDYIDQQKHAIDYLGNYNATETNADPCSGVTPACPGQQDYELIPRDNGTIPATIAQKPGGFTLFGGDIVNGSVRYVDCPNDNQSDNRRCIELKFTASVSNPVLAWGGHIAWRGDWGIGNSAGDINGSPYHMRLIDLDGFGGNQDRSLKIASNNAPGRVTIIKEVISPSGSSSVAFDFTASAYFGTNHFSLVDDNEGPGIDRTSSSSIRGAATLTVTEGVRADFTLLGVTCTDSDSHFNGSNGVNINVSPGEFVTCTFQNGTAGPSAASASLGGRVLDWTGRGVSGAMVVVTGVASGSRYASTNAFGYYTVDDLPAGDFYVVNVSHKRFTFTDNTRGLTLNEAVGDVDFIANP